MGDLISRTTRGRFRSLMTASTVGEIESAFQDEGFAPNPDGTYQDSSIRRETAEAYLSGINWADVDAVNRALRVFQRLLTGWAESPQLDGFRNSLRQDQVTVDDETGVIELIAAAERRLTIESMQNLSDAAAIEEQIDRIQRAADDPALVIGCAKELVESTAKVVLTERGRTYSDRDDLPALVRSAQGVLGLQPSTATPGPDGTDAVRRILGAVSTIAIALGELRNRGWGTGHGPAGRRVGLHRRHADLAVNAAVTWCQLVLDTLVDPDAPWRSDSSNHKG